MTWTATTTTYNAAGQPLTITNANEVITYTDQAGTGYLQSVTGPVANSLDHLRLRRLRRVSSVTEPGGYSVTMLYDALIASRAVRIRTPPTKRPSTSGSTPPSERDRKGRITRHFNDGLGRRTSRRDPQRRVITQVCCA